MFYDLVHPFSYVPAGVEKTSPQRMEEKVTFLTPGSFSDTSQTPIYTLRNAGVRLGRHPPRGAQVKGNGQVQTPKSIHNSAKSSELAESRPAEPRPKLVSQLHYNYKRTKARTHTLPAPHTTKTKQFICWWTKGTGFSYPIENA